MTFSRQGDTFNAMKTTLELPDEVYARAETYAARHGITFSKLVADSLEKTVLPESSVRENQARMAKFFEVVDSLPPTGPVGHLNRDELYDRQVLR